MEFPEDVAKLFDRKEEEEEELVSDDKF